MKEKYVGIAKVGEKGQIVIPKEARDMFDINPGDSIIVLCDKSKGIALLKAEEIEDMAISLNHLTNAAVVLTGVSFEDDKLGCCCYKDGKIEYYFTKRIPHSFHGTGDCFAASFFAGIIKGLSILEACKLACHFTVLAMENTYDVKDEHWYGVYFEKALSMLV